MTRGLGPDAYGNYVAATSFLFLPIVLSDLGLATTVLRDISARPEDTEAVMRRSVPLRAGISAVAVAAMVVLGLVIPFNEQTQVAVLIWSVGAWATLMNVALLPVLQSQLRMHWAVVANVMGRTAALGLTLGALAADLGFEGVVWAQVIGVVVTFLVDLAVVGRLVRLRPIVDVPYWRNLVRGSIVVGLAVGLGQVFFRVDGVILALVRPAEEVGFYGAAYKFLELADLIVAAIALSVFPTLTHYVATANPGFRPLVQRTFDVLLAVATAVSLVFLIFPEELVLLTSGAEFLPGADALRLLAPYPMLFFVNALLWRVMIAAGHDRALLAIAASVLTLNVVLNVALLPDYGFRAASVNVVVTEVFSIALSAFVLHRREGFLPSLRYGARDRGRRRGDGRRGPAPAGPLGDRGRRPRSWRMRACCSSFRDRSGTGCARFAVSSGATRDHLCRLLRAERRDPGAERSRHDRRATGVARAPAIRPALGGRRGRQRLHRRHPRGRRVLRRPPAEPPNRRRVGAAEHRVRAEPRSRGGLRPADRLLRRGRCGQRGLARGDCGRARPLRRGRDAAGPRPAERGLGARQPRPADAERLPRELVPAVPPAHRVGRHGQSAATSTRRSAASTSRTAPARTTTTASASSSRASSSAPSREPSTTTASRTRSRRSSGRPTGTRRTTRGSSGSTAPTERRRSGGRGRSRTGPRWPAPSPVSSRGGAARGSRGCSGGSSAASAAASSTGCWRSSVDAMRLQEPVPLHRRQSGRVVEPSPVRRDERELARVVGDARRLSVQVDGLGELDRVAPGPARGCVCGAIRGPAEEVRKLLVEQRSPLVRERGERRITDEQVRMVGSDAVAAGEAGQATDDTRRRPAGAGGQSDEAAGVPRRPVGHLPADRSEIGGGPRSVEVLLLDEREGANAVRRAGEGGRVLFPSRRERGRRVGEAGQLVPGTASRRFRIAGEHRQDVERLVPVEQRRAGERGVVEVRLQEQDRRLRKAAP